MAIKLNAKQQRALLGLQELAKLAKDNSLDQEVVDEISKTVALKVNDIGMKDAVVKRIYFGSP